MKDMPHSGAHLRLPISRRTLICCLCLALLVPLLLGAASARVLRNGPPIKITVVNNSTATVLFAAFGPTVIEPEGGMQNWVQPPGGSLVLDIPNAWFNTQAAGTAGPRIWARTGCRYDITNDRAQCETGDCAGHFDCGTAGWNGKNRVSLVGAAPVTIAEYCINCVPEAQPTLFLNYWDVSLVDGGTLMMNVQPTGTFSPTHPDVPGDPFWCQQSNNTYSPNAAAGKDLRDPSVCAQGWALKSSDLSMFIQDDPALPNNTVACFSNCGKQEYPAAPSLTCTGAHDTRCGAWRTYCCQDANYGGNSCTPKGTTPQPGVCTQGNHVCIELANGSGICPGKPCSDDSACAPYSTCWTTAEGGQNTCACAGYAVNPPCPPETCTGVNLPAAEPPFVKCSQTANLPGIPNSACIGDDTVHTVFPRAYTWPNDPQTYDCDNQAFTVTVFGGSVADPITPASPIPACSSLPAVYNYTYSSALCSDEVKAGAVFASAVVNPGPAPKKEWSCAISPGTAQGSAGASGIPPGVLCHW